jgi:hypothetical protein
VLDQPGLVRPFQVAEVGFLRCGRHSVSKRSASKCCFSTFDSFFAAEPCSLSLSSRMQSASPFAQLMWFTATGCRALLGC